MTTLSSTSAKKHHVFRKPDPKPEQKPDASKVRTESKTAPRKVETPTTKDATPVPQKVEQPKQPVASTDQMALLVPKADKLIPPLQPTTELFAKGQLEVKRTTQGKLSDAERAELHVRETLNKNGVQASDEVVKKVAQTVGAGDKSEPQQPQFNQFEYNDKLSSAYQQKVLTEAQKENVAELYQKSIDDKLAQPSNPDVLDANTRADNVVGEGQKFPSGVMRDYTVAVPSDGDMQPRELMKQTVADVLRRNNRNVTPEQLDKITDSMRSPDGSYDFSASQEGTQTPERTQRQGPDGRPYEGYGLKIDMTFQKQVLDKTNLIAGPPAGDKSEQTAARMKELVNVLKHAPDFLGQPGAKEALTVIEQNLEKGEGADWNAAGVPSAIKAVCSYAAKIPGSPAYAAAGELMGRLGGAFKLPGDLVGLTQNFSKLTSGVDPTTGERLSREQMVDAAIGLVESGLDVVQDGVDLAAVAAWAAPAGKFGAATAGALQTAELVAPPAAAILMWVKMNWEVVKLGRQAINAVGEHEMNRRFPSDGKGNWSKVFEEQQQRLDALPTSANNAELTTRRILNDTFQNSDTRERFLTLLKREVSPEILNKIIRGEDPCVTPEESVRIAEASKRVAKQFMQAELDEVKAHPLLRPKAGSDYLTEEEMKR